MQQRKTKWPPSFGYEAGALYLALERRLKIRNFAQLETARSQAPGTLTAPRRVVTGCGRPPASLTASSTASLSRALLVFQTYYSGAFPRDERVSEGRPGGERHRAGAAEATCPRRDLRSIELETGSARQRWSADVQWLVSLRLWVPEIRLSFRRTRTVKSAQRAILSTQLRLESTKNWKRYRED